MDNIVLKDDKREFTILVDYFPHENKFITGLCNLFKFYQYDAQELINHLKETKDNLDDKKKLRLLCDNIERLENYQSKFIKHEKPKKKHKTQHLSVIPLW